MEPLQYEARGYLKEPFRLFHLADGRGEYIEYHYHTFHKIIILLAGRAGYAVEGERYELAPGDFVLVGSGSIHRPVVETGDYYERMILYIAPIRAPGRGGPAIRPSASDRHRRHFNMYTGTRAAAGCGRCSRHWRRRYGRAATGQRCWHRRSLQS